jgi:rhamnosyltransferase subunit B
MHYLIVSIGTDGDVFPYLGLAKTLRERGHSVGLVACTHYEPLARHYDLNFHEILSAAENDVLFENPDFWNPRKSAPLAAKWGLRYIQRQYETISKLVRKDTVLITNPAVFAATMARDKFNVPMISIVLQPWIIPSSIAPPVVPGLEFLQRAPRPVWNLIWRAFDAGGYLLVERTLNRIRMAAGLKPVRRVFRTWLSNDLILGFFPPWFGPPQADWPSQLELFDFPMFDGRPEGDLPQDVEQFCRAGPPPVAFTFGTGMAQPAKQFRAAMDTCQILGLRGIFLTKYNQQLPSPLPPSIMHARFAPFQKLFPHCAAVVHHGGIGTSAKAMAAGIPQLACPICFDQFDNGARLRNLGVGDSLSPIKLTGKLFAKSLSRLLTPVTAARCREIAARFTNSDGLNRAAERVEQFVQSKSPHAATSK